MLSAKRIPWPAAGQAFRMTACCATKIGQGAPRHILATLTVAAFRPWRGWACSDCAGLGQCFYIFVDYSNDLQLLKLHNEKEKGKRIFGNSRKAVAFSPPMAYFFSRLARTRFAPAVAMDTVFRTYHKPEPNSKAFSAHRNRTHRKAFDFISVGVLILWAKSLCFFAQI